MQTWELKVGWGRRVDLIFLVEHCYSSLVIGVLAAWLCDTVRIQLSLFAGNFE